MHKIRVGILRGGPSSEYEVSLDSGAAILKALQDHHESEYHPRDIFIDRAGTWHMEGVETSPQSVIDRVDVIFNALHGKYGEDGQIQHFLESHGMPFTGSGSLGSAIGMNKSLTKKILKNHGIKSPYFTELASKDIQADAQSVAKNLFKSFILPAVIKPVSGGSSVGVSIVKIFPDLEPALVKAAEQGDVVLVEEFIPGVEATCGVVEDFRGHALYALPPIEIRPHAGFFDYAAKYQHASEKIVPATFPEETKKELEDLARQVHQALGLRHYSRSDFIVHPRRGIYTLEVNTLPGMTQESLVPTALASVGSSLHELAQHLIHLALKHDPGLRRI